MKNQKISVDSQLDSIQSMLAEGHKGIRLEKHTLPLWGLCIGFLTAFTYDLSRPVYALWHGWGKAFEIGLVLFILLFAVWLDHRLTRKARVRRDETISIIQRKVTIVIWMLFAFAFVLDLYANMYLGGGRTLFGVYLVLGGIVLVMLGLYSESWYRWSGVVLVLSGLGVMFLLQPSNTTRLLTASIFMVGGIGIAILQPLAINRMRCMSLSLVWLALALGTAVLMYIIDYEVDISPDEHSNMSWSEYQKHKPEGTHIVTLAEGTEIPVRISVKGDVFEGSVNASLLLKTSKKIDLEFRHGEPTGIYRINGGQWLERNDGLTMREYVRKTITDNVQGPEIIRSIDLGTEKRLGGLLD